MKEYLEILESERDPGRVWEIKNARDLARGDIPGDDRER